VQLLNRILGKTGLAGRLIIFSALGGVLVAAMVVPVVAATGIVVRNTADKFSTIAVDSDSLAQRSAIYDRQGNLITYIWNVDLGSQMTYANGIDRQPVNYDQISPNMLTAIVAIEDDRFWQHGALDVKGTLRALVNDIEHKPIQGGSTLEQQYVKNVLVLQDLDNQAAQQAATADNLNRKLDQLRMAVQVAHTMTKPQILAGYLNDSYYGNGAWGIEAASETYFNTTAAKLTMTQAATLAGIVENPTAYDPINNPAAALMRRNTVLARIGATNPAALSVAAANVLISKKLGVHPGAKQSGCAAGTAGQDAFFCDYVVHSVLLDPQLGATTQDRAKLLSTGGLKIYTTLAPQDESAATQAVNYVVPAGDGYYNANQNVDTTALVQPGTGKILAIAEDRKYGPNPSKQQTEVDYAVNSQYGGQDGVQTGSSSKLFTLLTALKQGVPFGYQASVPYSTTVTGFTNCAGGPTSDGGAFPVVNSSQQDKGTFTLYTGTADSINTFYAGLEQKVGLCNVVHTAVDLGMTRADGTSLLTGDPNTGKPGDSGYQYSAENYASFTLGSVNVSPLSMAAAYATVASGGIYCAPTAISKITDGAGKSLPVQSAGCHRVLSSDVANAANYILQGVFTWKGATGDGLGPLPSGYPIAGKTGTSNVANGDGTPYAAFAGYTTNLVSYTSVFNPISPTLHHTMGGYPDSCFRNFGGQLQCPGEMFGADAPGSTWRLTFDSANLGGSHAFGTVSPSSELWSKGNGQYVPPPPKKPGKPGKGGTGGGGNGGGGGGGGGGPTPPIAPSP
jgi:membrane peptidoglycan carboxypeptidase